MTAALLFAATFAVVFTLGIQQINVERRHMLAAAATSPLIGIAHLVLFKVLPGPTAALDIAAYLAGGSAGIVAGIWAHPRLVALLGGRGRAERLYGTLLAGEGVATYVSDEGLQLGLQIADDAARADIESYCSFERMGNHTWYDSRSADALHGPDFDAFVATALRYLRLRERIVAHPTQTHLVRFEHSASPEQTGS